MTAKYQVVYFKSVKDKIQVNYRRFRHTAMENSLIQAASIPRCTITRLNSAIPVILHRN
jgi:hypothetical protein